MYIVNLDTKRKRKKMVRYLSGSFVTGAFAALLFWGGCRSQPIGSLNTIDGGSDGYTADGSLDGRPHNTDGDSEWEDAAVDGRSPPSCGNGIAEPGEECDGEDLRGQTCESLTVHSEGELACTGTCVYDRSPCHTCGDGAAEGNEECDGEDFGGLTCLEVTGHAQGFLLCMDDCALDASSCHTCGDGVRESSEECDGADLGGESCESLGFIQGGVLACGPGCQYDTSGCCGDGVLGESEECDGEDYGGISCSSLGFSQGGALTCTPDCFIDSTGCCGDGVVGPGEECDDQNHIDWDGCRDCEIVEFRINETTEGYQGSPDIEYLDSTSWVAVWISAEQDGDDMGVFARKLDSTGVPLGGEVQVNTYTEDDQLRHRVAAWEGEGFVVVWTSKYQDGDNMGVYAQRFDMGMQPVGGEIQVNDYTLGQQDFSSVATLSDGRFIVVWASEEQDGEGMGIFAKVFDGVTPVTGDLLVNTYTIGGQSMPDVASGPNDEVVVVWKSNGQSGNKPEIFGQLLDKDGNKVGDEFQINTPTQHSQLYPSVSASTVGFTVAWTHIGLGSFDSHGCALHFDWTGVPTSGQFIIDSGEEYKPIYLRTGLDDQGNIFVSWDVMEKDGDDFGVFARRFDASGAPLGPEFPVNQYTHDGQGASNIKVLPSGEAFLVWTSFTQDGSSGGVYGQRYDADGNPLGHMP